MILVLVGTNPYSFDRLVRAADDYAAKSGEKVFIQLGHTQYKPKYAQWERFVDRNKLLSLIETAEIVITQGGYGSLLDCLKAGKKIVAVPRIPELGEAPDRQDELVKELEKQNKIVAVYDIKKLPSAIECAKHTHFSTGNTSKIGNIIKEFIETNIKKKL